jgi:2-succinyl-6-hydroxy-2,4-cyclohexadiene-1-carboxylate synthase
VEFLSNEIKINVICGENQLPPNTVPIIFLHGFTGSAEDWLFVFDKLDKKFFPIAIDLPGHGKTITPENIEFYSVKSYVSAVNSVLEKLKIERTVIIGYSMGGRTALSFSVLNPDKVIALILESSTAGIEKESERISRTKIDSEIADKIISDGMENFVNYWMDLPFFESLKSLDSKTYSKIISDKINNSPTGLANSLNGFSTGNMPSLWHKLDSLNFPTLLIAGELDRKYVRINREMSAKIKNSKLHVFPKCGHNTHLENPEEFVILVNEFLNNLENNETQLAKS